MSYDGVGEMMSFICQEDRIERSLMSPSGIEQLFEKRPVLYIKD
jgi:hypothetical protein